MILNFISLFAFIMNWEDLADLKSENNPDTLLLLYDDILKEILSFCPPLTLYSLKFTCTKFHTLVTQLYPQYLFTGRIDFLVQSFPYGSKFISPDLLNPLDEHFIIQLGLFLSQYPENPIPLQWRLENLCTRKVRKGQEGTLQLTIFPKLIIKFNVVHLLTTLEHTCTIKTINACLASLPKYLSQTTKPYDKQAAEVEDDDDFFCNPEEFFWVPSAYRYEGWFNKEYPRITNYLLSHPDI